MKLPIVSGKEFIKRLKMKEDPGDGVFFCLDSQRGE